MYSTRLIVLLFTLISLNSITIALPTMESAHAALLPEKNNAITDGDFETDDYTETQSDDYSERMSDIFDLPLKRRRKLLEYCANLICMPHYLCINDRIVTNGTELLESRISLRIIGDGPSTVICDEMEMPCCADEALAKLHQPQSDATDNGTVNEKTDRADDRNENDTGYDDTEDTEKLNVHRCGYSRLPSKSNSQQPVARILNGDDARPNEFPWMVGLFLRLESDSLRFLGGGSLIHRSIVLTAAHLVRDIAIDKLIIRAGEHNIIDPIYDGKRQEQNVSHKIIHNDLYVEAFINDIALLVVSQPFELTEAVNTICLPPQSVHPDDGIPCTSCGWGKNAPNRGGQYQAALKKVTLPVNSRAKCEHTLRQTRLGPYYNLDESLLCAGGSGADDTCKGDGGSPLFCEIPQETARYYQAGIVAAGIGCGGNTPGLYVNVAQFTNWIKHQLALIDLNFDAENILSYEQFD